MNRRKFIARLASATAIALAAGAATVTIEGCSFNITDAINTVLNSALAILHVVEPNSSLYTQLSDAITSLEQAESTWQAGGASTLVVDALNTIEAVIAAIPETATYAPLVDILVAGIEAVMSAFGLKAQLSAASSTKRPAIVNSPHYNAATLNGPSFRHPTWTGAYKAQWNSKAKAIGLSQAQIH